MKKLMSIIPLLILLGVAFLLSDNIGTSKKDEADALSPTIVPQPTKIGTTGDNADGDDMEVNVPEGYKLEPTMTYSPDAKVYLTGEEYGVTYEQEAYHSKWISKEQKVDEGMNPGPYEPVKKENTYSIGDEIPLLDKKIYFTVNKVEIYDNISDFDKNCFGYKGYEADINLIKDDGSFRTIKRTKAFIENKTTKEVYDEAEFKFVVLDCTFTCDANWIETFDMGELGLVPLVERDGFYVWQNTIEAEKEGAEYMEIWYEGGPHSGADEVVMFDKSIAKKPQSFYWTYITKGEVIECKIGYFVDVDYLDNMYVYYEGTANSIYTDSCLQKFVKLFE